LGLSFGHRCGGRRVVWYNGGRWLVRFARKRSQALWGQ
jgi:hypothetical protein